MLFIVWDDTREPIIIYNMLVLDKCKTKEELSEWKEIYGIGAYYNIKKHPNINPYSNEWRRQILPKINQLLDLMYSY